jgi:16S rRNA processing protein RimM
MIGRITAAHGLDGEVRVQSMTSRPERFLDLTDCFVVGADEQNYRPVTVERVRLVPGAILVKLRASSDRTAAEQLRGLFLAVSRQQSDPLPPDHWFICDLVGCAVHDPVHGFLGQVHEILQHSAQDVYVVRQPGQPDLLFPARKSILRQVDISGRRIDVCLPDGLYEIYRDGKNDA